MILNTLLTDNAGWGLHTDDTLLQALVYNGAGYNNTSGDYSSALWGDVRGFVTLTADPYTNSAGGDYSLNATAGGGTFCRGTAIPGAFGGLATTIGYPDIGAVQTLGSGGAGAGGTIGWTGSS